MSHCKTLIRTPLSSHESTLRSGQPPPSSASFISPNHRNSSPSSHKLLNSNHQLLSFAPITLLSRSYCFIEAVDAAVSLEDSDLTDDEEDERFMKMELSSGGFGEGKFTKPGHWFPYLDQFRSGNIYLSSGGVLEALDPFIQEVRKEKLRKVVKNRSYSVCLVVEDLSYFGNASAAFRSADALGLQSVHVVSDDLTNSYHHNRHLSVGAEKWLDIELWSSIQECFHVLKSRGYRIATTHVGIYTVSIHDIDWSCPTAIVLGNEHSGLSDKALELSDLHCSIPMNGMVNSLNFSVSASILLHHAIRDRTTRLGYHGDLTSQERQILLAEFSLRHSKTAIRIARQYAEKKAATPLPKL